MIEDEVRNRSLFEKARRAIDVIIRPPRADYDPDEISHIVFNKKLPPIPRIPVSFLNRRKQKIVGSFYASGSFQTENIHRCIIYLHGNIGSQKEGRAIVPQYAPRGISVFCFDFSGSGLSDGEYVTLGYNESRDVIDVVNFLAIEMEISEFILWGRSMGATSAILAAPNSPLILGIIVDSAYSDLDSLFDSIGQAASLNSVIRYLGVKWIKLEVYSKAKFNCNDVSPISIAPKCTTPMLIGHAVDDDFIPYTQAVSIYEAYSGPKELVPLVGSHNTIRDVEWYLECAKFVFDIFHLPFKNFKVDLSDMEEPEHYQTYLDLFNNHKYTNEFQ